MDSIEIIKKTFFKNHKKPIQVILGTDWWTDCDDVVALRLLAWAQQNNYIKLEAIGINACMEYSAASIQEFLLTEGLTDIPLGIDLEATDFGGNPSYQKRMVSDLHNYLKNEKLEDAVRLYRRVLSQMREKIDIIEVGYPQVLANLLKSPADDISPSTGIELVSNKVNKLWMMAGNWEYIELGKENNFARNPRSRIAGAYVCDNWPTPITFLGWEISYDVLTGGTLTSEKDMVHNALCDHGSSKGRSSWDPMLVFLACCNDEARAGYSTIQGKATVNPDTGENSFEIDGDSKHCFVKKSKPNEHYRDVINAILEQLQQW